MQRESCSDGLTLRKVRGLNGLVGNLAPRAYFGPSRFSIHQGAGAIFRRKGAGDRKGHYIKPAKDRDF
jgi:hypothetical protein